jgi:hypothetical protein
MDSRVTTTINYSVFKVHIDANAATIPGRGIDAVVP